MFSITFEGKKIEYCENNNLIIPFDDRNTDIELWRYCNPYSFKNITIFLCKSISLLINSCDGLLTGLIVAFIILGVYVWLR